MADLINPAIPASAPPTAPAVVPEAAVTPGELASMFSNAVVALSQPDVAEPASPPSITAPVANASPYAAEAAKFGITLPATASDQDVFAAMQSRFAEEQAFANYARALMPHAAEINDYLAKSQAAPATTPPSPAPSTTQADPTAWDSEKYFADQWRVQKLTPQMETVINAGMVIRDADSGLMVAKPGFELVVAPLLGEINQSIDGERNAARQFLAQNPYKQTFDVLKTPLERMMDQRFEAKYKQLESKYAEQQVVAINAKAVNDFEQSQKQWLFQPSATGEPMLTEQGSQFVELYKQLQTSWTGDNATLLSVCNAAVRGIAAAQPAGTPPTETISAPSVASAAQPHPAPDKRPSFLDTALRQASHQPSAGAHAVQSPDGPAPMTAKQLEDFFLTEYQAQHVAK